MLLQYKDGHLSTEAISTQHELSIQKSSQSSDTVSCIQDTKNTHIRQLHQREKKALSISSQAQTIH